MRKYMWSIFPHPPAPVTILLPWSKKKGGKKALSIVIKQLCGNKEILFVLRIAWATRCIRNPKSSAHVTHLKIPSDTSSPFVSQPLRGSRSTCPVCEPEIQFAQARRSAEGTEHTFMGNGSLGVTTPCPAWLCSTWSIRVSWISPNLLWKLTQQMGGGILKEIWKYSYSEDCCYSNSDTAI